MVKGVSDMKIGLIGFFGAGAFSDDLIEYVTRKLILKECPRAEIDYKWREKCRFGTDPDLLNSFDIIIHAGGSLLGKCSHYPIRDIFNWHDKVETPIAIFGTGYRYEPDKEPLNTLRRLRLQLLFEKAEVISVRGHSTIQHLQENRIDTSKVHSVGDPVMACDISLKWSPKFIMGNVRDSPDNEIKHSSNYVTQKLMAQIYDYLIDYYDLPLRLISFRNVLGDNDLVGAEKTVDLMRHATRVSIKTPENFMDAVNLMDSAQFWFGQRLHPTIFAAVQGIPFVGVEYQFDKMIDWVSTLNMDGYIHTATSTLDDFIEKFEKIPVNTRRLKKNLPKRIEEIKEVVKKIVELA